MVVPWPEGSHGATSPFPTIAPSTTTRTRTQEMPTMDQAAYIAALEEERNGYVASGKKDRVKAVDEELALARGGASKSDPNVYPAKGSAGDVLAYVGDDEARAEQALEIEEAKGDKARSSVVTKLKAILGRTED